MFNQIPVACVHCSQENTVTLDAIDERKTIKCSSCSKPFSINDVFQHLYEHEDMAKDPINCVAGYAAKQWGLDGGTARTRRKAEKFLEDLGFENMLNTTANQILVHGDSFLQVGKNWQLLSPQNVRVKTSFGPMKGSKAWFIKDDEFKLNGKSLKPSEVVHFKKTILSAQTPYGESMLLSSLTAFSHLKAFQKAVPQAQGEAKYYHDLLTERVWMGTGGIPGFILKKQPLGYDNQTAELLTGMLIMQVEELQYVLCDGFEEALQRYAKQEKLLSPPKLQLTELTSRRVLLDCGFNFSKEIEMWKKLREQNIITEEELNRQLSQYKP